MNLFPIIILCGGAGTRLSKYYDIPKSMIPFKNKPFISYQLELLGKKGFSKVILCLGIGNKIIKRHIMKNYSLYDIDSIFFSSEYSPLGTGGAIKNIIDLPDIFFVTYGDTYLNIDYEDMQKKFIENKKLSTMAVYKNNNKLDKSNVKIIDDKKLIYTMNYAWKDANFIDYGVSIFDKKIFDELDGKFSLSEIQEKLSKNEEIAPYIIKNRFYEIGSIQGIKDFKKFVEKENL